MNGSEHLPEHSGAAQLVGATSPGEPNAWPADAGEFAARYNSWTPGVREEWLQRRIQSSQEAERCFLQMHEGRIEQLTAECDALRAQLDGMTTSVEYAYGSLPDRIYRTGEDIDDLGAAQYNAEEFWLSVLQRTVKRGPWVEVTD